MADLKKINFKRILWLAAVAILCALAIVTLILTKNVMRQQQQQALQSKAEEEKIAKQQEVKLKQEIAELEKSLSTSVLEASQLKKAKDEAEQKLALEQLQLVRLGKDNAALEAQKSGYLEKINSLTQQVSAKNITNDLAIKMQEKERMATLQDQQAIAKPNAIAQGLYKDKDLDNISQERNDLKKQNAALQNEVKIIKPLSEERNNLAKENSALKISKASLDAELTKCKKLYAQLAETSKELYLKLKSRESDEKQVQKLNTTLIALTNEYNKLKYANDALRSQLSSKKNDFENEKAVLYYELGVVYTQEHNFDLAFESFKKSLEYNPKNADTHYKLGLLYKYSRSNDKKAIYHLRKYLELSPQAKNKADVEYIISMLEKKNY